MGLFILIFVSFLVFAFEYFIPTLTAVAAITVPIATHPNGVIAPNATAMEPPKALNENPEPAAIVPPPATANSHLLTHFSQSMRNN